MAMFVDLRGEAFGRGLQGTYKIKTWQDLTPEEQKLIDRRIDEVLPTVPVGHSVPDYVERKLRENFMDPGAEYMLGLSLGHRGIAQRLEARGLPTIGTFG